MKRLISFFFVFLLFNLAAWAQKPMWEWAREGTPATTGNMIGYAVAADGIGNHYVTGKYKVSSTARDDIFVAKYDEFGALVWFKTAGSGKNDAAVSIAIDPAGYVYITGYYSEYWAVSPYDTAFFDGYALKSEGESDIFVAKYSPAGDVVWAKSFGGTMRDAGRSITTDNFGHIYVTGEFADAGGSPPLYGTAAFDSYTLLSSGNADVFVIKLDTSSNLIWAKSAGGNSEDIGWDVGVDQAGSLYLSGGFDMSITLDNLQITSLNSGFMIGNFFLAKYDSDGNVLWAKQVGGAATSPLGGTVDARRISVGASGNIYVVGTFEDCTLKFHNGFSVGGFEQSEIFLAKYDQLGSLVWAISEGGDSEDYGWDIATDEDDNVYITGAFGTAIKIGADSIVGSSSDNVYVAKYESSGTPVWALSVAGMGYEFAYGIAATSSNSFCLTGHMSGDELVFGSDTVNRDGLSNYFLAKASGLVKVAPITEHLSDFLISPNPAFRGQTISIRRPDAIETKLILTDVTGRPVYATNCIGRECSLNIEYLPGGLYFVSLLTSKGTVTKKLIIQ